MVEVVQHDGNMLPPLQPSRERGAHDEAMVDHVDLRQEFLEEEVHHSNTGVGEGT